MIFSLDLNPVCLYLICATAFFALTGATAGLRHMRKVARAGRRMNRTIPEDSELPGISVIVYAHNAEDHIARLLESLLAQNHPLFEVIVVNDASIDNTHEIVENMLEDNPRLYLTFVSESARNISHRKLAYTIGLRAAKYPVALLTSSNISVPSDNWLRLMSAPFADPNKELVIGTAYVPKNTDAGAGRYWRSFDALSTESRWIGAALCGHTYRGTAYNLALRPSTFFERKGFASTNRFQSGEDDIFVNELSTPENTSVCFRDDAMVVISAPSDEYPRLWKRNKERYTFTSHYLHTGALRMQGLLSLCSWGTFLCAVAAILSGMPNIFPTTVALVILLCYWGDQICVYRRAAAALKSLRLWWSVPFLWLIRPIANACYRVGFQANKHTNYTWQQPR